MKVRVEQEGLFLDAEFVRLDSIQGGQSSLLGRPKFESSAAPQIIPTSGHPETCDQIVI